MTILYEDPHVICDEDALTINLYYFPLGSKRIPYSTIRSLKEETLGLFTGSGRLWGMGITPEWFHFDLQRPLKPKAIVIEEEGNWIKSVITPNDHDRVLQILREKLSSET